MSDPDLSDLRWLVDRRNKIQSCLLQLYERIERTAVEPDKQHSLILQLLLGAAFSLWRAVFLAGSGRELNAVDSHAKEFLQTLIKDNAINYPQDQKTRSWSVGYYLNNAHLRLQVAYQMHGLLSAHRERVNAFLSEQVSDSAASDALQPWDGAHAAILEILTHLSEPNTKESEA
jgi:hypothetical protein